MGALFHNGRPQKRSGHTRQTSVATSCVPRALHAWRDLSQQDFIGAGSYVIDAGAVATSTVTVNNSTGSETRPINASALACIRY